MLLATYNVAANVLGGYLIETVDYAKFFTIIVLIGIFSAIWFLGIQVPEQIV
jgi:hypothetical protein